MTISTWSGRQLLAAWLAAVVLAVGAVAIGNALRPGFGNPTGFFVGSLFVWILWIPLIATWRWIAARERAHSDRRWRVARVVVLGMGGVWLCATVLEYAAGLL